MAVRMVSAREIVGRRIVAFDPGTTRQADGPGYRTIHYPSITLDDGSRLFFCAEELPSADADHGTLIGRVIP